VIVDRYPVQIPFDAAVPQVVQADAGFFVSKSMEASPSADGGSSGGLHVLGSIRILPELLAQPHPARPFEANLDDAITLLGYDLSPVGSLKPGQNAELTLYWQGNKPLSEDYSVFVHLRDLAGRTVAQDDGFPSGGTWPTSAWEPGLPVVDKRLISIPADVAPGKYDLWAGMYRLSDQTRLPVLAPGQEVQDDAVLLGEVEVRGD
jgi:hypothetical protein